MFILRAIRKSKKYETLSLKSSKKGNPKKIFKPRTFSYINPYTHPVETRLIAKSRELEFLGTWNLNGPRKIFRKK